MKNAVIIYLSKHKSVIQKHDESVVFSVFGVVQQPPLLVKFSTEHLPVSFTTGIGRLGMGYTFLANKAK